MVGDVGLSEEADAGEGPHLGLHGRMETSASEGQVIVFSTFPPHLFPQECNAFWVMSCLAWTLFSPQ